MMVRAGTHVDPSVSMHGWAHSIGYRTYYIFDLPPHHLLHHHQPSPFCCPQESEITSLTKDDNPLRDSLASPGAQGDHRPSKAQAEVQTLLLRQNKMGETLRAHLFAKAITSFRVGCCIELHLHRIFKFSRHLTALLSFSGDPGQVRFESDSFPICVNNHASYCMANSPHLSKT